MTTLDRLAYTHAATGTTLPYLSARPTRGPSPAGAPLLLFLHGGRDRGSNELDLLLRWAPPKLVAESADLPFHFVAPQIPVDTTWTDHGAALLGLVDELVSHAGIDADRVVLAGFSLGAAGAWQIASQHPERFAGLVAVSGRVGDDVNLAALKATPAWVFHGGRDDKLPSTDVERAVAQLRVRGASVNYTLYPHGDHFIADQAFTDAGLQPWLLSRHRGAAQRAA